VEWDPRGEVTLTVRVTGRWRRRRRPLSSGQPLLVLERAGRRHRFPASPEPPSLTGAAPGTWQMSFSVPLSLAPRGEDRVWLQIGAVVVPLPIIGEDARPERAEPEASVPVAPTAEPQLLTERRLRSAELALQGARERAAQAEREAAAAATRLHGLTHELELARTALAQRDAARRAAEQRAFAEGAERLEAQEELAQLRHEHRDAQALGDRLAHRRERVYELEEEIERWQRRLDEAEQLAAAAAAGRRRAQQAQREAGGPAHPGRLALERELASRSWTPPPAPPAAPPSSSSALSLERRMRSVRAGLEVSAPLGGVDAPIGRRRGPAEAPLEPAPPNGLASPLPIEPSAAPLDPVRLDAALSRLREAEAASVQPRADPPSAAAQSARGGPTRGWLEPAFRSLTAADPATAGRLVLALLPVQRLVHPGPLRYDLVLAGTGCVQVTIPEGGHTVQAELRGRLRPPEEVHFSVHGDLAALARLLAGGTTRRRLGRAHARIRGDRRVAEALLALIRAPLRLEELLEAVPAAAVAEVLAGLSGPRAGVRGEGRPVALVQRWIERAQSG